MSETSLKKKPLNRSEIRVLKSILFLNHKKDPSQPMIVQGNQIAHNTRLAISTVSKSISSLIQKRILAEQDRTRHTTRRMWFSKYALDVINEIGELPIPLRQAETFILSQIENSREIGIWLKDSEPRVLEAMMNSKSAMSIREISEVVGLTTRAVQNVVNDLVDKKVLNIAGKTFGSQVFDLGSKIDDVRNLPVPYESNSLNTQAKVNIGLWDHLNTKELTVFLQATSAMISVCEGKRIKDNQKVTGVISMFLKDLNNILKERADSGTELSFSEDELKIREDIVKQADYNREKLRRIAKKIGLSAHQNIIRGLMDLCKSNLSREEEKQVVKYVKSKLKKDGYSSEEINNKVKIILNSSSELESIRDQLKRKAVISPPDYKHQPPIQLKQRERS